MSRVNPQAERQYPEAVICFDGRVLLAVNPRLAIAGSIGGSFSCSSRALNRLVEDFLT